MSLKGKHLIIPLLDATLNEYQSINFCPGCSIIEIPQSYIDNLDENERVSGYYKRSINDITIGFRITPTEAFPAERLRFLDSLKLAIFCCMVIRLSTGVPVDVPFWLDVSESGDLLDFERTLVRTYRNGPKYKYPLDEGIAFERLNLLSNRLEELLNLALKEKDHNRVIRAIDFASIGFQTYHIPTRLVNHVTFLETLFSTSSHEITFQLASRISWYVEYKGNSGEREKLFDLVKDIYKTRSQVVHGGNVIKPTKHVKAKLVEAEDLNTKVFCSILRNDHVKQFSMSEKKRHKQFKKLSIGIQNDFYPQLLENA